MILAIDMGNTNITLGCFDGDKLIFVSRMYTERHKTCDEFATQLLDIFGLYGVSPEKFSGAIFSSVVPELTDVIAKAVFMTIKRKPLIVGKEYNGDLKVDVIPIEYLGSDIIAGCIGAINKYKLPCIVADLGTATKVIAIDKDGYFLGCTISPGVQISLTALAEKAALLPSISFIKPENVVGTNTVECMQSGSVYGTAAMLDGLIERFIEELKFKEPCVIATGGYSKGIIPCCKTKIKYDENLLLYGLFAIYNKAYDQ